MRIKDFNNFVYLLSLLLLISCENKKDDTKAEISKVKTDSVKTPKQEITGAKIEFENYARKGILLKGMLPVFDNNLVETRKILINENSNVNILEKSKKIYNIGKSADNCLKSNFVKINFNGQNIIVFGQNIYEIDEKQKFSFQNDQKNNFSIFPVTNFEIGASDYDGLTGCDDFSYLIIADKNDHLYPISSPKNKGNRSNEKFAILVHDDGMLETIDNVKIVKDSLIVKVNVNYQEGFGSYHLNTCLKDNFSNSTITKEKRFAEPIHHR